jgi:hypothetical protein
MTAAIGRFQTASVSDFRTQPAGDLHSEIFTARSVGEIVVKVAVEEGVITTDAKAGLVVNLHQELSELLGSMLVSFSGCLGAVLRLLAFVPKGAASTDVLGRVDVGELTEAAA